LDGSGDLTFSRASSATRVASNGLIEKVRTNLVTYSQAFDNAAWTKGGVGTFTSAVTAGFTDPTGGSNAQRWLATIATTSDRAFVRQLATLTNGIPYNVSFWIKSNTASAQELYIQFQGAPVVTIAATTTWTRISFTQVTSSTSVNVGLDAKDLALDVLIYGFQLETGDIATDYIPTTTAAVSVGPVSGLPRLDYLNSSCPRLLLEPQRTNLASQSEDFNGWATKVNVTTTANYAVSPDGYQNADRVVFTGNGFMYPSSVANQTIGVVYTLSCYAKRNGSGTQSVGFFKDGSGGIDSAWTLTSNWQRFTYTYTASNTSIVGIGGTSGADVSVYGFQYEVGAYATSYIPTLGTSVTRVADAASKTGANVFFGTNTGTIVINFDSVGFDPSSGNYVFDLAAGVDAANRILVYFSPSDNTLRLFYARTDGTNAQQSFVVTMSAIKKIAVKWTASDIKMFYNGTPSASFAFGTSAPNDLTLFARYTDTEHLAARTSQVLTFPTALTDAQCIELTTI
jgi:hypothetical protein